MFIAMVVIFVLGYLVIALEHPLRIDKAATSIVLGVLVWVAYIVGANEILTDTNPIYNGYLEFLKLNPDGNLLEYISHNEILHYLAEISEILFFLLGAMTIVEIVDQHGGFEIITNQISTTHRVKLLWIVSIITFFLSSVLDNLTTTIIMVALLRKLVSDKNERWFYSSIVVIAANAGGAWSPIGDVTTIMLWVKGLVTTGPLIMKLFLSSMISLIVPLVILSFKMKGNVIKPVIVEDNSVYKATNSQKTFILFLGIAALLFVPVFKTITHLPPYMGMLLGLGIIWIITEIMHKKSDNNEKSNLYVTSILKRVDVPTVLFFLGILSAVAALQSAGHLSMLGTWLDDVTGKNIYVMNTTIGIISSVIDNVPLVAGAMGMYPVQSIGDFMQDGNFWSLLAYCAGTGGSILIIGSAAGVAAMGLEKIDFIWYLKKISLLALIGYLSGIFAYFVIFGS